MRVAYCATLTACPLQNRQSPAWPFFDLGRTGVVIFLQAEQTNMTGMRRREAGDLHVIAHHVLIVGERMRLALEVRFLVVPTGTPAQHTGDVQIFSDGLPPHVLGLNAFLRTLVVAAACGMHVMVTAV